MQNLETLRKINKGLRVVNIIASIGFAIMLWVMANEVSYPFGDEYIALYVISGIVVLILGIVFACFLYCLIEAFADLVTNSYKSSERNISNESTKETELPEL